MKKSLLYYKKILIIIDIEVVKMLPREKLILNGSEALSDDELLAILLGYGSKDEDVFSLSKRLINDYGFTHLFNMSYNDLSKIKGIKEAKATKLLALFEIARRISKKEYLNNPLKEPIDIYNFIISDYLFLDYEKLTVIYVNSKCNPIHKKEYSLNEASRVNFPIQTIIKHALEYNAYGIFLVHNHPSGDPKPSYEDLKSTNDTQDILKKLNIYLLDHIIISNNKFYSINQKRIILPNNT